MLKVTYIGHATNLIEWKGLHVLTDPVFSKAVLCFNRKTPLAFDPARLPKLDAIVISHAHYDHLDLFSFKYIPSDVPVFVPAGVSNAIAPFVKNPVVELATWSRFALNKEFSLCAVPAKHPGGRFLFPFRYRACQGFVLSQGKEHIYFGGDTAYGDHFSKMHTLFSFKLALIPLARGRNDWISRYRHLDADSFIQAWEDLGRPDCIPYHWGAFFGGVRNQEPFRKISAALGDKFHFVELGECFSVE